MEHLKSRRRDRLGPQAEIGEAGSGPPIGLVRRLADDEETADRQQRCCTFGHGGRGTEGAGGDGLECGPLICLAAEGLSSAQHRRDPVGPAQLIDRFGQQGHPALHGIQQDHPEIRPTISDDEPGDSATRAEVKDLGPLGDSLKGTDEPFSVVNMVEHRTRTEHPEGPCPLKNLDEHVVHSCVPGMEHTMAPPEAGPSWTAGLRWRIMRG